MIVFDAINQLDPEFHNINKWLPSSLPARVHIVVSTTPNQQRIVDAIIKKGIDWGNASAGGTTRSKSSTWKMLRVKALAQSDRKLLITQRLHLYGKIMAEEHIV